MQWKAFFDLQKAGYLNRQLFEPTTLWTRSCLKRSLVKNLLIWSNSFCREHQNCSFLANYLTSVSPVPTKGKGELLQNIFLIKKFSFTCRGYRTNRNAVGCNWNVYRFQSQERDCVLQHTDSGSKTGWVLFWQLGQLESIRMLRWLGHWNIIDFLHEVCKYGVQVL